MSQDKKEWGIRGPIVETDDGRFTRSPIDGSLSKLDDGQSQKSTARSVSRGQRSGADQFNLTANTLPLDDDVDGDLSADAYLDAFEDPEVPAAHDLQAAVSADPVLEQLEQDAERVVPQRERRGSVDLPARPPRSSRAAPRRLGRRLTPAAGATRRRLRGRGIATGLVLFIALLVIAVVVIGSPGAAKRAAFKHVVKTSTTKLADGEVNGLSAASITRRVVHHTARPKPRAATKHVAHTAPVRHVAHVSPTATPVTANAGSTNEPDSSASSPAASEASLPSATPIAKSSTGSTTPKPSSSSGSSKGVSSSDFGGVVGSSCNPTCP